MLVETKYRAENSGSQESMGINTQLQMIDNVLLLLMFNISGMED